MPNHARSHSESLSVVCLLCFNKAVKCKKITEKVEELIKNVMPNYNPIDDCFPSVICNSCYIQLNKGTLTKVVDYESFKIRLKRNELTCSCEICDIARFCPNPKAETLTIPMKHVLIKNPVGRPSSSASSSLEESVMKICAHCKTEIHKGIRHSCTVSSKVNNTVLMARGCEQQVASKIIRAQEFIQGSSIVSLNKGKGIHMQIKLKRKHDKSSASTSTVSTSVLKEIQEDCNLSLNSIKKVCSNLRSVNKKLIEPNAMNKIQKLTHSLDNFFSYANLPNMFTAKQATTTVPFIYCCDLPGLVHLLVKNRQMSNDFHVKVGIDSGGGSLKICLSLLSNDHNPEYVEQHKSSGIKKLLIIGLAPSLIESYHNLKYLFQTVDLQSVCSIYSYTFAADLKLIMMLLGLQSNSSCHPCPWCDIVHQKLDIKGKLRTINSITEQYISWKEQTASDLSKAKEFFNCTNIPLITGEGDAPVLKYVPPPELHLMMGVTQHIFDNLKKMHLILLNNG